MEFEWNPDKAAANARKHGVEFSEAVTIFGDPFELTVTDPDHSLDERRFISIGTTISGRLLVVAYIEREARIRIINARDASSRERKSYESRSSPRR